MEILLHNKTYIMKFETMQDATFLKWIYNRLIQQHKENKNIDYMLKLKTIVDSASTVTLQNDKCTMKVNGTTYGFTINPHYNDVLVEIYKVSNAFPALNPNGVSLQLISKKFGKWYRKPIEMDYINAKQWANNQMRCIFNANK